MTHGPRREIGRLAYIPLSVTLRNTVFWAVTPCSLTQTYELFRGVKLSISPLIITKFWGSRCLQNICIFISGYTASCQKDNIFRRLNFTHRAVPVIWINRTIFTLLKYSKRFLVSRVRMQNATVSFVRSVSLSVQPFIRPQISGRIQPDGFFFNFVLGTFTKLYWHISTFE
jgi:hypothetical protein